MYPLEKIWRTHKEHEECEEQEISNKHIARNLSQFCSNDVSVHFPIQVEDIWHFSQDYTDVILELKTFPMRLN